MTTGIETNWDSSSKLKISKRFMDSGGCRFQVFRSSLSEYVPAD